MEYEIKKYGKDPLEIARGDCSNMEVWWEPITLENLHKLHKYELAEEAALSDSAIEYLDYRGEWHPSSTNFNKWLRARAKEGKYIRAAKHDA